MLIVADEIKIQIDETIKNGVTKDDFILWLEEEKDVINQAL